VNQADGCRLEVKSPIEEVPNRSRDFATVSFQCEMAGRIEMDLGCGIIPLERFGAGRQEKRIVLSPYCEKWRLVLSELLLKSRVKRDVTFVVAE